MIKTNSLTRIYGSGSTEVRALDGVDMQIDKGEFVSIQGPSGCGKSTLLNIVGCLEQPSSGEIRIDDVELSGLSGDKMSAIRREKIGFIFQSYNLIPTMNALDNVMLPMIFAGKNNKQIIERATMLLDLVDMGKRAKHKPAELSGGEQQRVAVARALINDPSIIIGDEPTGNLDSKTGDVVMELLLKLNKDGRTILLVTHDADIAGKSDRIMHIRDGRIVDK